MIETFLLKAAYALPWVLLCTYLAVSLIMAEIFPKSR